MITKNKTKRQITVKSIKPEILKINREKDKKLISDMKTFNFNNQPALKSNLPAIGIEYKEMCTIETKYRILTRIKVKVKRILGRFGLPGGYVTPLYHLVVFFPNNQMGIMPVPQNLDGSFSLKKTTFLVNQEDVKYLAGNSFLFYNHDDVIPLRVASRELDRQDVARYSLILNGFMANKLVLDFLKESNHMNSNTIKYMIIAVLIIVAVCLIFLLHFTGVIDLSTLFNTLGGK
jgi:hypothetical protein